MSEEIIRLPIRSALIPVFYKNFHCLAQDCRDSCCVGWKITFDKKDYLRLRRLDAPEDLRERLEKSVRRRKRDRVNGVPEYGEFDLRSNGGRCPFLNAEGLCSIQLACGGEALPRVCREYPRNIHYTTAAREYTLSTSCEGVLQQLWDLPEGVEFIEDPLPKAEWRRAQAKAGSLEYCFAPLRAMCIDILQERSLPLAERMLNLGITLQRLMAENWESLDPDEWIGRAASPAAVAAPGALELPGNRGMYLAQNLEALNAVSTLHRGWSAGIYAAMEFEEEAAPDGECRVSYSPGAYDKALEEFEAAFGERAYFFENVMVAVALYLGFPWLGSREELWKSYVSLCSLYSFFRFVSVLGCKGEAVKERLFHMIVMASRSTLHNQNRLKGFQEELFQHESSTLAHMAILLRG